MNLKNEEVKEEFKQEIKVALKPSAKIAKMETIAKNVKKDVHEIKNMNKTSPINNKSKV
jgi:hypothetical protein